MINPELIDLFMPYIVEDANRMSWEEMTLKDDAPLTARLAYDEYMDIMLAGEREGEIY